MPEPNQALGCAQRKGRASGGANGETGSQCSVETASSGGDGAELGARCGSAVVDGGDEGAQPWGL